MAVWQGMRRGGRTHGAWLAVLCLLSFALWSACSGGGALDAPDSGRSVAYEPGLPSFDLEAIATVSDGQPGVEAFTSIPRASLVFIATDSSYVARYDLTLEVESVEGGGSESFTSFGDTLTVAASEATQSYDRIRHREQFDLAPGVYVVEAVLEDLETGEQAVRRQRVEVRGLTGEPRLSRPLVLADMQPGEAVEPVVALHVPARRDSLQVRIEAYDAPAGATLDLTLTELRADTTVAIPPFWISPSRGSLVYRGIDSESADTLLTLTESLTAEREQPIVFALPTLGSGSYHLDLRLRDASGATLDRQERSLSVKGVAFPRLATLAELVAALDYIAYPREMEFITSGDTPQERRHRFDAFWGALVSDRRVASNLLRLYYERVEEANLLFTSHKAGWKTDRGMVYVIFGAPGYVEETFDGEIWHYGYGEQDAASTFVFERADYYGDRSLPGHYVLVRQPVYERAWRRALDRWRRGAAL
jgi:GWxTD domain-containing protein